MLPELAAGLSVPGTILVQYDNNTKGKMFECVNFAYFLIRESRLHRGRRGNPTEWEPPMDVDFSRQHGYYNIEPNMPVRLFVDFDEPRSDPELMSVLRRDPVVFWNAVHEFVRRLGVLFPGFQAEWTAVFKSTGDKLSAHLHDLQIWAEDVNIFQGTVQDVLDVGGEHQAMLQGIVDTRIHHGNRAWRIPGHCKRAPARDRKTSGGDDGAPTGDQGVPARAPRYLALGPDPDLSGAQALRLFETTIADDPAACVSWAAFCYPHAMATVTRDGFEARAARPTTRREKAPLDLYAPLPRGKRLRAVWEKGV